MSASRSTLLRRALVGLGVSAVAGAGVLAFTAGGAVVEVLADGGRHEVDVSDGTVGDALTLAGVQLGPADLVTPAASTEVEDGLRVVVTRAITVDVVIDDQPPRSVTAPVASVGGVLLAADLQHLRDEGAVISPSWREAVGDGDTITVRRPLEVVVEVDGDELRVVSLAAVVDDVLSLNDVEVGPHDLVLPPPSTVLDGDRTIVIQRIGFEEETEEVGLPYAELRRETGELERGTTEVSQEGRDGLRVDRFRVRYVDGEPVGREVLSREIVTEPRDRIVLVGTAEPPPPPPPPPPSSSSPASSSSSSSSSSGSSLPPEPTGVPGIDDPVWNRLAQCEANGDWSRISANGMYYGGLQFHPDTWRSVGGAGMPHEAPRREQIRRAQILLSQPWATWGNQWPACSRMLGLS
jgi:resuscitation-promoting factor RpfB